MTRLVDIISHNIGIDIFKYSYKSVDVSGNITIDCEHDIKQFQILSGLEYTEKEAIPYVVWLYALKRDFLIQNKIEFAENVRFEDVDFSINCIVHAKDVMCIPLQVIAYVANQTSTSVVKADLQKIEEMFKATERVKNIALKQMESSRMKSEIVLNHHWYMYKNTMFRYLWRLSPSNILRILATYHPYSPSPYKVLNVCAKYPFLLGISIILCRPFILMGYKMYSRRKR